MGFGSNYRQQISFFHGPGQAFLRSLCRLSEFSGPGVLEEDGYASSRAPWPSTAADTQVSIIFLRDSAAGPESQSRCLTLLGGEEWLEEVWNVALRNARTVIGDYDLQTFGMFVLPFAGLEDVNFHVTAWRSMLDGVLDERS